MVDDYLVGFLSPSSKIPGYTWYNWSLPAQLFQNPFFLRTATNPNFLLVSTRRVVGTVLVYICHVPVYHRLSVNVTQVTSWSVFVYFLSRDLLLFHREYFFLLDKQVSDRCGQLYSVRWLATCTSRGDSITVTRRVLGKFWRVRIFAK